MPHEGQCGGIHRPLHFSNPLEDLAAPLTYMGGAGSLTPRSRAPTAHSSPNQQGFIDRKAGWPAGFSKRMPFLRGLRMFLECKPNTTCSEHNFPKLTEQGDEQVRPPSACRPEQRKRLSGSPQCQRRTTHRARELTKEQRSRCRRQRQWITP